MADVERDWQLDSAPVAGDTLPRSFSAPDLFLAGLVILVWGLNFVVAKLGVELVPPLTLATLRFTFSAFPAVLLLPHPKAAWRRVATFGLTLGLGQSGLLFLGMSLGVSAGLAALAVQIQAFFTIGLAAILFKERPRPLQLLALAVSGLGIALIIVRTGGSRSTPGLLLVLLAALAWAGCNLMVKAARPQHMVAFLAWSSVFALPPLLACTFLREGAAPLIGALRRPNAILVFVVFWQSAANTLFGFGIWNSLLGRYETSKVAPLSLLVPVVAMALSWALLSEAMQGWKLTAALLVVGGLALNTFCDTIAAYLAGRGRRFAERGVEE